MNGSLSDRLVRVGPLALRWGLAAILIYNGLNQLSGSFGAESGETFSAHTRGVELSANWSSILGAAQMGVGALLTVGLLTRLTSLAVLAAIGFSAYSAMTGTPPPTEAATDAASAPALNVAGQIFEANGGPLLLLAAVFASLLFSGAGCVSWDTHRAKRGAKITATAG